MKVIEPVVHDNSPIAQRDVLSWKGSNSAWQRDVLAVEAPLEIRLAGCSVAVTMRTPGHDFDLATGFLYSEGIIRESADIGSIAYCPPEDPSTENNIVNVNPTDPSLVDPSRWQRNFYATSSCGVCGKASIDAVRLQAQPISSNFRVTPTALYRLGDALREGQEVFGQTGGLHAAGLFDLDGRLLILKEDVGRHNAVDKVIGEGLRLSQLPFTDRVLMVSGRASFEVVQKALMAGVPVVAAVSAPSSLAVELAEESGMTLLGFMRTARFNVYTGHQRVEAG